MMPLYDMLARSQGGQGLEMLARQFNLSQEQAQAAVGALLPAFSQGLKRNTADPYGLASFLGTMASGQHAQFFDDATKAFAPQGVQQGNDVLGQLFGSKDVSRAVAAQAAQATGLGQDLLKQMLPAIASMIMGGLFKQSTNQMQAGQMQAGGFGASNPLGEIIEQMMKQGMGGGQAAPAPQQRQAPQPADPFDNPFGKMLKDMLSGGQPQTRQPAPQAPQAQPADPLDNPFGKMLKDMFGGGQQPGGAAPQRQAPQADNPLGRIFEEMMRGGQASREAAPPEPEPAQRPRGRGRQPKADPGARPRNPYDDIFGKMFETGAKQRDDYQKGIESIFDQFTKGIERYR